MICALLFFATTLNYVDRQVLGILAPALEEEIGWSESDYGFIVTAFQFAYAIGLLLAGRAIDRFGTRIGYAVAVTAWSVAAMVHGAARSAFHFGLARFALGLGEAGNFPAAVKTVAEWFPKRERALATGIFNAGSNVGAILGPLTVPWIAVTLGWRWAFILTGALGFVWVAVWRRWYGLPESHPRVSAAERQWIQSEPEVAARGPGWLELLRHRETWGFALARFLTDPAWWIYLYWVPKFLHAKFGLTLEGASLPLVVIYLIADVGSVGGGWLSSWLLGRGWPANRARKTAILLCIACILPVCALGWVSQVWLAVALLGMATAGHQGWAANIFTILSDVYPGRAVGTMVGLCGLAGSLGGMVASSSTGLVLEWTGSYTPVFFVAGLVYLAGITLIHLGSPRLSAVALRDPA